METLKHIHLLQGLDEPEFALLAAKLQHETFPVGTAVLRQGYASDRMYILLEGRASVLRKMGSTTVLITELEPTQTFGEMGMVDGELASATVEAVSDLQVLSISRGDFESALESSPALQAKIWRNLARELTRRIRSTTNQVQDYFAINQALCENDSFREFYKLYGP
jgi:CRP/FNR family cyclic AMP-dependent transcriptional regulator